MSNVKAELSSSYLQVQKSLREGFTFPENRRALVIGTTDGPNIATYIAKSLLEAGFEVWAPDRSILDALMPYELCAWLRQHGPFDTLVLANAQTHLDWFENQTYDHIAKVLDNTLVGSVLAANVFVKETIDLMFLKNIVFVGSMAYRKVLNGSSVYCAAKAGLAHFAECLGYELTPKGYRVFCVHPSNVEDTPMTEETIKGLMRYRNLSREEAEEYWGAENLMPEWLQAQHIGEVVRLLVDGEHEGLQWLTGTNIELTGGQR